MQSGLRYTPFVAGDINGDGSSNDRAFIFDPSRVADTAVSRGLRDLLTSGSASARDCLSRQINTIAGRNSCVGPWSATMNAALVIPTSSEDERPDAGVSQPRESARRARSTASRQRQAPRLGEHAAHRRNVVSGPRLRPGDAAIRLPGESAVRQHESVDEHAPVAVPHHARHPVRLRAQSEKSSASTSTCASSRRWSGRARRPTRSRRATSSPASPTSTPSCCGSPIRSR